MNSRPSLASKRRPSSAIFLGSLPPPNLPDLPEPPSPGTASNHSASGLPSPPATNSTGSGSTGDNSADGGSLRRRSTSDANMVNGTSSKNGSKRPLSPENQDDDDEDNTARLSRRRSHQPTSSSENADALKRVMSLTQRNRAALDKLARLNSPSPSLRGSTTPLPPLTGSTSRHALSSSISSVSSRRSSYSHIHTHSVPSPLSGSETERESQHSDDQSATPPSSVSHVSHDYDSSFRTRTISMPDSPTRVRTLQQSSRSNSPAPGNLQRTPRKRLATLAMSTPSPGRPRGEGVDVTAAAMAAVESLRMSPTSSISRRNRNGVPRELRETFRNSMDGRTSSASQRQPSRDMYTLSGRGSPSPKANPASLYNGNPTQLSPRPPRSTSSRFATVRESSRRPKWPSEDMSSSSLRHTAEDDEDDEYDRPSTGHTHSISIGGVGRAQFRRAGSVGDVLGTRLIGSGLRAAGIGIGQRDNGDDPFGGQDIQNTPTPERIMRPPRSAVSSSTDDWNPSDEPRAGPSSSTSRTGGLSRTGTLRDRDREPKTPANAGSSHLRGERGTYSGPAPGGRTSSMSDFNRSGRANDDDVPSTAPPATRTYNRTYMDRDREGIGSRAGYRASPIPAPLFAQERSYGSPRVRSTKLREPERVRTLTAAEQQAIEHLRLMEDSLTSFETALNRLPVMGETTTATIPELHKSAQGIVRFAEQVNEMLRNRTNRALERQIESEVDDLEGDRDEVDMVGLWNDVGSDFRDCLRVSDELVRTMTGLLLGVGKVLREAAPLGSSQNGGQAHLRGVSLDEEMLSGRLSAQRHGYGMSSPDGRSVAGRSAGGGSGKGSSGGGTDIGSALGRSSSSRMGMGAEASGRRSAASSSRRSWDPNNSIASDRDRDMVKQLKRASSRAEEMLANAQQRSASAMMRERERDVYGVERDREQLSPSSSDLGHSLSSSRNGPATAALGPSTSTRRTYQPRDRERKPDLSTHDSERTLREFDPSPTPPSSRAGMNTDMSSRQPLPPIDTDPGPLPSPDAFERRLSERASRRKISSTSNITVRANPSFNISSSSATVALSPHTVSNNLTPEKAAFPMLSRTDSTEKHTGEFSRRRDVTFSRPSTISTSALNGVQQRHDSQARGRARVESGDPTHAVDLDADNPDYSGTSASDREPPLSAKSTRSQLRSSRNASESERPSPTTMGQSSTLGRRRTLGAAKARASLDAELSDEMRRDRPPRDRDRERSSAENPRPGSSQNKNASLSSTVGGRRERRRTITEIFAP